MAFIQKYIQDNRFLFLIFALALILRLTGITHGYPYIFNIDEPTVVRSTLSLRFTPFIDHFDWPHFNYYLNYLFYFIFIKLRGVLQAVGLQASLQNIFPVLWSDPFIFYLISRIITAIFGALSIFPAYFLGLEIFKKTKPSLFGALFLSVIPFHVYFTHFALQDGIMLFWLMLGIYFAYIGISRNELKFYLLSGLFFGLSVGTKYNAILFMAMVPAFAIERYLKYKKDFISMFKKSVWLSIVAGLTFVITSYSMIFKWSTFWSYEYGKGILWQLKYNVVAVDSSKYLGSLVENIFEFNEDLSLFGVAIMIVGIFLVLKNKKEVGVVSMIIASVAYFLYVSRFARSPSHYYLPIYAFLPIFAGYAYSYLKDKYKVALYLFVSGMLVISLFTSIKFLRVNTKTEAITKYLEANKGKIYYKGEGFDAANSINNLGIKKYTDSTELMAGSVILSIEEIKDGKIELVEFIDAKNRYGDNVYVYKVN